MIIPYNTLYGMERQPAKYSVEIPQMKWLESALFSLTATM